MRKKKGDNRSDSLYDSLNVFHFLCLSFPTLVNAVENRSVSGYSDANHNGYATPDAFASISYPESEEVYGLTVAIDNDADRDGVFSDLEALYSAGTVADEEESWVELRVAIHSKGTRRKREPEGVCVGYVCARFSCCDSIYQSLLRLAEKQIVFVGDGSIALDNGSLHELDRLLQMTLVLKRGRKRKGGSELHIIFPYRIAPTAVQAFRCASLPFQSRRCCSMAPQARILALRFFLFRASLAAIHSRMPR